jgi:hypothetical protein
MLGWKIAALIIVGLAAGAAAYILTEEKTVVD